MVKSIYGKIQKGMGAATICSMTKVQKNHQGSAVIQCRLLNTQNTPKKVQPGPYSETYSDYR